MCQLFWIKSVNNFTTLWNPQIMKSQKVFHWQHQSVSAVKRNCKGNIFTPFEGHSYLSQPWNSLKMSKIWNPGLAAWCCWILSGWPGHLGVSDISEKDYRMPINWHLSNYWQNHGYHKIEILKLSKNYRYRKMHQIWSDKFMES